MLLALPFIILTSICLFIFIPTVDIILFILTSLIGVHCIISLAFLYARVVPNLNLAKMGSYVDPPTIIVLVFQVIAADLLSEKSLPTFGAIFFPPIAQGIAYRVILGGSNVGKLVWMPLLAMVVVGFLALGLAVVLNRLMVEGTILWSRMLKSSKHKASQKNLDQGKESKTDRIDEEVLRERECVESSTFLDDFAVKVAGMTKSFSGNKVVNDVFLGLKYGECFGLLGHNGAGKTTLINVLSGNVTFIFIFVLI